MDDLLDRYRAARAETARRAALFSDEDCGAQSMADASPVKWHLAHTTWFFERLVLARAAGAAFRPFDAAYDFLFNSYYDAVGERHPRAERGLLTRPSLDDVRRYRAAIDELMAALLTREVDPAIGAVVEVGLEHEMQHAELIVTDATHLLSRSALHPAVVDPEPARPAPGPVAWRAFDAGVHAIGDDATRGFAFDHERPRHRVFAEPFEIAGRLVTNGEVAEMIADGGYERPDLWLSDGWAMIRAQRIVAPLYWQRDGGPWLRAGLDGLRAVDPHAPARHISHYEADAFARWAGARLPTEAEWEIAARAGALPDAFGEVWQWTASAYLPYPGFRPLAGALGEYNGKFMSGQMVLRGASSATPRPQHRVTYRNFFPPAARWQVSGLRLARDR